MLQVILRVVGHAVARLAAAAYQEVAPENRKYVWLVLLVSIGVLIMACGLHGLWAK